MHSTIQTYARSCDRPFGRHQLNRGNLLNIVTRLAVGSLAVLAVAAPTTAANASAPATQQGGRSWTTIETMQHAKHQACKVSVQDGDAWKIYNRLDSRDATGSRLRASMTVLEAGAAAYAWTSGWVRRDELSTVGSVLLPRAAAYELEIALRGDESGKGGPVRARDIGRC